MTFQVKLVESIENITYFEGVAKRKELKNGGFEFVFMNNEYQFSWKIYKQGLIIRSISDIKVHLTLKEKAQTRGHIDTEFGSIPIQCRTSIYKVCRDHIEVKYELLQEKQSQWFHFTLFIREGEKHVY